MKTRRKIIRIVEEKCDGCGLCIPNCPEGALQIIDGKARLISDLLCDGLGACLGECPRGAIVIEEREAVPYDERKVMEEMAGKGANTVRAHLRHLKDHGQDGFLEQARNFLKEKGLPDPLEDMAAGRKPDAAEQEPCGGCPGARAMSFGGEAESADEGVPKAADAGSQLRQWPVQLHLVSPLAPYFRDADVVLAADCTAYACGDFHGKFLKGRALAIACPKLDEGREIYIEKIRSLIDDARVRSLTVIVMEVPCCSGLAQMVQTALGGSKRRVPVHQAVIGIRGETKREA